jgi:hypothetical protein
MAFRYVHIRPNLPLAIRAVEGVRSTPSYVVTSRDFVGEEIRFGEACAGCE